MQKNQAQNAKQGTAPCSQASILTRGGFFVILYHKVDYQTLRKNKKERRRKWNGYSFAPG